MVSVSKLFLLAQSYLPGASIPWSKNLILLCLFSVLFNVVRGSMPVPVLFNTGTENYYYLFFLKTHGCFLFLINLFIFGCVGSPSLCEGPLQLRRAGATLHRGARASHHRGLSCCGAQAPDTQAQQLWCTGLVAPRHVGSSQTRARTRVPCTGRQTPNHCATREAPRKLF